MKPTLLDRLKDIALPRGIKRDFALDPGLYPFEREVDGIMTRFHLRVDSDGSGLLLANASEACRLSPSGVLIAHGLLNDVPLPGIRKRVENAFRNVDPDTLDRDIDLVQQVLVDLASPDTAFPVSNLDDPAVGYRERSLAAPYRADMSVMDLDRATDLMNRLWDAGVPHVVFRPEPPDTLSAVVSLVERAGDLGMIAGVRATASFFADEQGHRDLAWAGVDHLTIPMVAPADLYRRLVGEDVDVLQEVLDRCRQWEVCVVAQVPLVDATFEQFDECMDGLRSLDVENFSAFAIAAPTEGEADGGLFADLLPCVASWVEEWADEWNFPFTFEPPLRRDPSFSLTEQIRSGPRAPGEVGIRIDREGNVYPPRGPRVVAGNLLRDSWKSIWRHPVFRSYRERVASVTRCDTCPGLAVCAADCPRSPAGWADDRSGGEAE